MEKSTIKWLDYSLFEKLFSIYIMVLPIMKVEGLPVIGSKIQLSETLFVPLFFAWIFELIKQRKIILPKTGFLVFIIICISGFSLIEAVNLQKGVLELLGLIYLSVLFILTISFCDSERRINILLNSWVTGSGIVIALGLVGLVLTYIFQIENPFNLYYHGLDVHRLISTFRNPNMLASYLLVSTAFISGYRVTQNTEMSRSAGLLMLFLLFIVSLFTVSREIAGITFCLALVLHKMELKHAVLRRVAIFGLTSMFVGLIAGMVISTQWMIFPLKFSLSTHPYLKLNTAPSAYKVLNDAAVSIISQHPFTGAGIGSYGYWLERFPEWAKGASIDPQGIYSGWGEERSIHNMYLGWGAEIGLMGLLFIIIFFLVILWNAWKAYKTSKSKPLKMLSYFMLSGMIGMLMSGFTLNILILRHFWILMGIIVAISLKTKQELYPTLEDTRILNKKPEN